MLSSKKRRREGLSGSFSLSKSMQRARGGPKALILQEPPPPPKEITSRREAGGELALLQRRMFPVGVSPVPGAALDSPSARCQVRKRLLEGGDGEVEPTAARMRWRGPDTFPSRRVPTGAVVIRCKGETSWPTEGEAKKNVLN